MLESYIVLSSLRTVLSCTKYSPELEMCKEGSPSFVFNSPVPQTAWFTKESDPYWPAFLSVNNLGSCDSLESVDVQGKEGTACCALQRPRKCTLGGRDLVKPLPPQITKMARAGGGSWDNKKSPVFFWWSLLLRAWNKSTTALRKGNSLS